VWRKASRFRRAAHSSPTRERRGGLDGRCAPKKMGGGKELTLKSKQVGPDKISTTNPL